MLWLLIALSARLVLGEFIERGQQEFYGEDQRLAAALRARMEDVPIPAVVSKDYVPDPYQFVLEMQDNEQKYLSISRRYAYKFPTEPEPFELKHRSIELMRHHIYATQYRMRDMDVMVQKYGKRVSFRIAQMFCRLDTLISDMVNMLRRVNQTMNLRNETRHWNYNEKPFWDHLIYYTYFLKKNIDVAYIVQQMINLHTKTFGSNLPDFSKKKKKKGEPGSRPGNQESGEDTGPKRPRRDSREERKDSKEGGGKTEAPPTEGGDAPPEGSPVPPG